MKYQNLKSFYKHLESASPGNLCNFYFIGIADDFERSKALSAVLSYFPIPPVRFNGSDCDLKEVLDAMGSMSLLGESVVVLDEVDKLGKKQIETLCKNLNGYVLFGARSKTAVLADVVEKKGVVLSLFEEKPWDREKRLSEQLIERARREGKKISMEAASMLLERLGADPALLESEIAKLICFAAERSEITREDILKMVSVSKASSLWQTAEEVVWEGGAFPPVDSGGFHSMIPALRSQLHLGLSLATLIQEKRPVDQWNVYLPKIWPKTLEKRSSQAARLGVAYFRKGLDRLFDLELSSRNGSTQYGALLDLFRASLHVR